MFGLEKLPELKQEVEDLNQHVIQHRAVLKSLIDHSQRQAELLPGFFQPQLQSVADKSATLQKDRPLVSAADWDDPRWEDWQPDDCDTGLIRVGTLLESRSNGGFSLPAYLPFIGHHRTIIVTSRSNNSTQGAALLQSLLIRTALMLPYQTRYVLLDPAGNGIAFPTRRYLAQVRENSGDVRRDLDEVIKEIQRMIESYLDATLTSFEQVPHDIRINERFQLVFAADFPNQYDRRAIEALQSIGNTGTKAGTYVFIHYNQDYELPRDMSMDGFKTALYIDVAGSGTFTRLNMSLRPDSMPAPDRQRRLFEVLNAAKPPERMLDWDDLVGILETEWWQVESTKIIETPIGARGGGDRLGLWFGVNKDGQPCAHGMLGAMTGAGKSNLYHVLINGLAVRYSPAELRLYLIDGKDGVEFQPYRHLPHAEVVSLRSSPELSRSVLTELIAEKERRNAIFAEVGVNDLASYRAKGEPAGKFPRILLLIDEYQELFEGDKDGLASNYLLQLSQQGRSAGIHMLLASQRFGAAGMMNQTGIFGNVHLLMAMQMRADDVQALTQFGRRGRALVATCDLPGKIVVNDRGGDDTGNVAGKVAYLEPSRRDELLQKLIAKSCTLSDDNLPRRVVFNGKSQPGLLDNPYVATLTRHASWPSALELERLARDPVGAGGLGVADWFAAERPYVTWLGQQFNVRGQASLVFRRRVGENVMLIGSNNPARYGMLSALLIGLGLNSAPSNLGFVIVDRSIPDSPWNNVLSYARDAVLKPAGFIVQFTNEAAKVEMFLSRLLAELDRRSHLPESQLAAEPSLFILMTELDGVEALRRKPDSYGGMSDSPLGENLQRLYVEGSSLGLHLILSFAGVRLMSSVVNERHGLIHFQHRVALQMSEDESHTFVRSRRASQLQVDGTTPICGLYVDLERDQAVRFKPYSIDNGGASPAESMLDQIRQIGISLANRRPIT